MKKLLLQSALLGLLSLALAVMPAQAWAQNNNKPEADKQAETAKKKKDQLPFNGKVGAIDKTAKIITVGQRKFQVTSETKFKKAGKPATLEDAVVGEQIAGSYRKTDDGKLNLLNVRFGPRPEGDSKGKSKKKAKEAE